MATEGTRKWMQTKIEQTKQFFGQILNIEAKKTKQTENLLLKI